MKTRVLFCIVLFLAAIVPTLHAAEVDYIGFVNLECNLLQVIIFGDTIDLGSGVVVDFNTGNMLWHLGLRIQYMNGFGIAGEAGAGVVLGAAYDTSAEYTQVFQTGSWTVGNIRYTEYERIEGHCPAAWLHVLEAGVRPHYVATFSYNFESTFSDLLFYAGYRFASFYQELVPIQEVEFHVHGVVGITGRYQKDSGFVTRDNGRVAFGAEIGVKYYIFHMSVAYYDGFFYMDYAMRFAITFM